MFMRTISPRSPLGQLGDRVAQIGDSRRTDGCTAMPSSVTDLLAGYQPQGEPEAHDLARIQRILDTEPDPWSRATALHLTASALILHPATGRVLLRWHQRQQAWLQVGGHGDPGEADPLAVALREGAEETGLADLVPWPDRALRHAVIVPVPAGRGEPAHEHADLRFVLATGSPGDVRPETADAPLRWLSTAEAARLTSEPNLRESLARLARLEPAR
jgi:8-oxo-dGTP pyrophosphatase MutT (NUDIX family)